MNMKCQYCGNPIPGKVEVCPSCGAPVRKFDNVVESRWTAEGIEYSDKKFYVFLMKNLVFGKGYFYIGRSNLGALTVLIDILALLFAVICTIYAAGKWTDYLRHGNYTWFELLTDNGGGFSFRLGIIVFFIVYLAQRIAAFFVKTDGEGKRLR